MLIVVYRVVHKLTPFIIYFWEWANNSWPCDRPGSWWLWLSCKAFYPQSCNTWVPKNLEPQAIDGHLMSSFKISFIPNGEYINLLSHLSLVWRPFILLAEISEIRTNSAKLCPKLRGLKMQHRDLMSKHFPKPWQQRKSLRFYDEQRCQKKIKLIHQVTFVIQLFIPHDTIVDDGSERHQVPQCVITANICMLHSCIIYSNIMHRCLV